MAMQKELMHSKGVLFPTILFSVSRLSFFLKKHSCLARIQRPSPQIKLAAANISNPHLFVFLHTVEFLPASFLSWFSTLISFCSC